MSNFEGKDSAGIVLNAETARWQAAAASFAEASASVTDVARARAIMQANGDLLGREYAAPPAAEVCTEDFQVGNGQITVRRYWRKDAPTPAVPYVYLHGGAFWLGSIDEIVNQSLLYERVALTGVHGFAVEYRLAPEFPAPAAIEDAVTVLRWLADSAGTLGVDPGRILLGGISAGANLAAAVAAHPGSRGLLRGLVLEVPAIDLRPDGSWLAEYAEVNLLNSPAQMAALYAPQRTPDDPEISPLLTRDLGHFPPAHVLTAEYDPHRAGGEALAARLRATGVQVTATRHLGALHGSVGLTRRDPIALAWRDDVCAALRRLAGAAH